ncbi:hypothetical protein [Ruania halotolerans]|uniref:hypothetical protein n=1 Tax=Ruania halotolerans TaxID=2897773 RepID=UPI001E5E2C1B|nr:hypothetical protein [Ruania halotolerans]UFU05663.1 hypothetical protein LQF10_14615 [Ruania halotolerans]
MSTGEHTERHHIEETETAMSTSPSSVTSSTSPAQTVSYGGASDPSAQTRRGPRMRSVVWGLVLILLGAVVIAVGLGARLDPTAVTIGILAIAGATLLVGALISAAKGR